MDKYSKEVRLKELENENLKIRLDFKREKWISLRVLFAKSPLIMFPISLAFGLYFIAGKVTNFKFLVDGLKDIIDLSKYSLGLNFILAIIIYVIYKIYSGKNKSLIEDKRKLEVIIDKLRTSTELNEFGNNEELK